MRTYLDLLAASLGEEEDATTRIVGDSLYVRYSNYPTVLKITVLNNEVKVLLQLVHPEHGPIDSTDFTLPRPEKFTEALEQVVAYLDIWFV